MSNFNHTDIMSRLRAETRPFHDQLETLPFSKALLAETLPLSLYVGQLEAYLPIHRALEKHNQTHTDSSVRAVWQADMCRVLLLMDDLAQFNAEMPTAAVQLATTEFVHFIEEMALKNPEGLLGILYVFEGSTLGARMIAPRLQSAYQLGDKGVRYYQAYQEQTVEHWKQFSQRMNNTITDDNMQNIVLDAARKTFTHVHALFVALWKSQ
jgi:heme oxygenase (biliverdin-IX-beta and delta-forming)